MIRPISAGSSRLPSPAMGRKYTSKPTSPQMSVRNKAPSTSTSTSTSAPLSRQSSR